MPDTFTILAFILTVVLGLLSIYFYFKSRSFKGPTFVYSHAILQTKVHPKITILFEKQRIANLSQATILFYNSGTKEIRREDIPGTSFPIIAFPKEIRVLSHGVLCSSSANIALATKKIDDQNIQISFSYLNSLDGAVIEVLFEDSESRKTFPGTFHAEIIGSRKINTKRYDRPPTKGDNFANSLLSLLFLSYPFYIFTKGLSSIPIFVIIIFAPLAILGFWLFWRNVIIPNYERIPPFARHYFDK